MGSNVAEGIFSRMVERAFLVGVVVPGACESETEKSLSELESLIETLGVKPVESVGIKLRELSSSLLLTKGKAEYVLEMAEGFEADCIVFDLPLSPSQQRNWEALSGLCVIDREEVIIDIFASRARTREARLQVDLALAEYSLPRLTRAWSHLSRQRGGSGVTRDAGETQLEIDRRIVLKRISKLKKEIELVKKERSVMRKKRANVPVPSVSIIGYTNAGKSSLLNLLSDSDVFVENQLFATLDPVSRKVLLNDGNEVVFTDTVGFIRNLPHHLIDSFRSTLEETLYADLLLNVVDVSDDNFRDHIKTSLGVVKDLEGDDLDILTVFNKVDVCDKETLEAVKKEFDEAVFISTKNNIGIDVLKEVISDRLSTLFLKRDLLIPYADYSLVALLRREGRIVDEIFEGDFVRVSCFIPRHLESKFSNFVI